MENLTKPKIQNVNVHQSYYQGQPIFLMHNNLKLTEAAIALPQSLGPLAMLCDGRHTIPEIGSKLASQYGIDLSHREIEDFLHQFDEALILDGQKLAQAKQRAVAAYRAAPFRKPALAGHSYPADPEKLRSLLQNHLDNISPMQAASIHCRGIISPHIDYQRGGHVYAQVWANATEAIREAELVIIFGTDHNESYRALTLTPQNYASPFGVMPTDSKIVNRLVEVLGPEQAFAEELHHRDEWSIELDLVWLQYLRNENPCPLIPILCGSFGRYMSGSAKLAEEDKFKHVIEILRDEMSQRRTVVLASGDLAHLGPAFDGPPLDATAYEKMKLDDNLLMNTLCQGEAKAFIEFMKGQYERNVCGLSPFYFTLDLLGQTTGQIIAYDCCSADGNNTSFVSVCGIVFS